MEMPIELLVPTSGSVPTNGYDDTSLAGYTAWEVNDQARFSIVVPDGYLTGADFTLSIQESTPSSSVNHSWEIDTLLVRPSTGSTSSTTPSETVSETFTCDSVPSRLATRSVKITGFAEPGQIGGTAIAAGDMLSVTVRRATAEGNEDPEAIRVFNILVLTEVSAVSESECPGRLGRIIDTVRDLFNEATGGFISDEFIIRSVNRCMQDLAQHGYWKRESWLAAHTEEHTIDLPAVVTDYQDIHQVGFSGQRSPMTALGGFKEYEELKTASSAAGVPRYWVAQNNILYVWPTPSEEVTSGYCVYHSYLPGEIACSPDRSNPPIPPSHDMVFVYFVLKQAFLRDRHAPGADIKYREYAELYDAEKHDLLGEGDPPKMSLRSYR